MNYPESQNLSLSAKAPIHWGHFGVIMMTAVLLLGLSWFEKPQLFDFHKSQDVADNSDVPRYYPYVAPSQDQVQPQVLGASTDQGPEIIGDDGTVQPVDLGEVLGASTQGVVLSTADVKVNTIPDSAMAITNYFIQAEKIELDPVDDAAFEAALSSNDQNQLNQQAQKLTAVVNALQKLSVPRSLVNLQQLKIVQYNSAIALLQNFTQADQNPTLVDQYLEQFIKSQQDLDTENANIAQKFGSLDPQAALYSQSSQSADGLSGTLNDSNATDNASQ